VNFITIYDTFPAAAAAVAVPVVVVAFSPFLYPSVALSVQ